MASNGRLPQSALGPIPGNNAGLRKDAAAAYRAMARESRVDLGLDDGPLGRCYRNFARQVLAREFWCSQGRCGNAAIPGTSNHGLGIAVDLENFNQRNEIDRIGRKYGWAKEWSDAQHEWWHLRWREGVWEPPPDPLKDLPAHVRFACNKLLYHRRAAIAEQRTGEGPRFHKHVRWRGFWRNRVVSMLRRARKETTKTVLRRVLADRDGTLE